MSRRDIASLVAGFVCLALAAALALFARDVRAWPQAFREGDTLYRAQPAGARPWESPDRIAFRPAERLLDVRDDVAFRRAIRLYQLSRAGASSIGFRGSIAPSEPARRLFLRIDRRGANPRLRSRALNFLGVMSYNGGAFIDASFSRQASRLFRRAILLDPANEEAKFNLELMMFTSPENPASREGGGGGGRARPDAGGAGLTPPGRGY